MRSYNCLKRANINTVEDLINKTEEEMMKVFVNERSRFYSVANDTKCQVTFDPVAVESYRLIGYENRLMSKEDFEDEKKDALRRARLARIRKLRALKNTKKAEGEEEVTEEDELDKEDEIAEKSRLSKIRRLRALKARMAKKAEEETVEEEDEGDDDGICAEKCSR